MFLESIATVATDDRVSTLPESISPDLLIDRIEKFVRLDAADMASIRRITRHRRQMSAHETLVHEDRRPDKIYLLLSGFAIRYRYLVDGRRQVFGYILPGDLCDTHFVISNNCDHQVTLLSDADVAVIAPADLMATMVSHPRIERALLLMSLVDAAILRECLLNLGQRNAFEKLAHFFCEITARLAAVDLVNSDGSFSLPLTQNDLADTMGLTVVHVNRMLRRFRDEGLLCWSRRRVTILDRARLELAADFKDGYLRLGKCRTEPQLCAYG